MCGHTTLIDEQQLGHIGVTAASSMRQQEPNPTVVVNSSEQETPTMQAGPVQWQYKQLLLTRQSMAYIGKHNSWPRLAVESGPHPH